MVITACTCPFFRLLCNRSSGHAESVPTSYQAELRIFDNTPPKPKPTPPSIPRTSSHRTWITLLLQLVWVDRWMTREGTREAKLISYWVVIHPCLTSPISRHRPIGPCCLLVTNQLNVQCFSREEVLSICISRSKTRFAYCRIAIILYSVGYES